MKNNFKYKFLKYVKKNKMLGGNCKSDFYSKLLNNIFEYEYYDNIFNIRYEKKTQNFDDAAQNTNQENVIKNNIDLRLKIIKNIIVVDFLNIGHNYFDGNFMNELNFFINYCENNKYHFVIICYKNPERKNMTNFSDIENFVGQDSDTIMPKNLKFVWAENGGQNANDDFIFWVVSILFHKHAPQKTILLTNDSQKIFDCPKNDQSIFDAKLCKNLMVELNSYDLGNIYINKCNFNNVQNIFNTIRKEIMNSWDTHPCGDFKYNLDSYINNNYDSEGYYKYKYVYNYAKKNNFNEIQNIYDIKTIIDHIILYGDPHEIEVKEIYTCYYTYFTVLILYIKNKVSWKNRPKNLDLNDTINAWITMLNSI